MTFEREGHASDKGREPNVPGHGDDETKTMREFFRDVEALRQNARKSIFAGPIDGSSVAERARLIYILNQALATELVCVAQLRRQYVAAEGLSIVPVANEILEFAFDDADCIDMIAARIRHLGGEPEYYPSVLRPRAQPEFENSIGINEVMRANLAAKRVVIRGYSEIVEWLGSGEPTTRRIVEEVLANKEDHSVDLLGLIASSA